MCDSMTYSSLISGSQGIKGETTDEAFQGLCFLWERLAPVGAQESKTGKEKKMKKYNKSP